VRSKQPPVKLSKAASLSGIVASLVILIVMVGTVLIVLPTDTPGRSAVTKIAAPYFTQSWRVFAPNIAKKNMILEMRAQWRNEDDELVKSGWVSITGMEQIGVTGNPLPSNIRKSTLNASSSYLKRYQKLDSEQQERARTTFIERDGEGGFQRIPDEELIAELGEDDGDVIRFLRMDYMMMRNMTLYATAGFGHDIERVQWRIVTSQPNDFTHRFDDEQQYSDSVTAFGWRQSNVRTDTSVVDNYRQVIERFDSMGTFKKAADDAE